MPLSFERYFQKPQWTNYLRNAQSGRQAPVKVFPILLYIIYKLRLLKDLYAWNRLFKVVQFLIVIFSHIMGSQTNIRWICMATTHIFYSFLFFLLMLNNFIKVSLPQGDGQSPKKAQGPSFPTELLQSMQEIRIGDYQIKAERISADSIDGYSVISQGSAVVYEGEMSRSRKNGFGVEYSAKGSVAYEGYFREDKYDGWGRTGCYTGQFRDGLYDGYGIYCAENYYYEGFFQKAQPSGEGISFRGNGMAKFHPVKNIYDFLNAGLRNAMGILEEYKIEEIYLGEWKEGAKHGFGRLWRANYWYSGQFSNDLPHGLGAEETRTNNEDKVVQTIYKLGVKK